jgi:hypothetical protein
MDTDEHRWPGAGRLRLRLRSFSPWFLVLGPAEAVGRGQDTEGKCKAQLQFDEFQPRHVCGRPLRVTEETLEQSRAVALPRMIVDRHPTTIRVPEDPFRASSCVAFESIAEQSRAEFISRLVLKLIPYGFWVAHARATSNSIPGRFNILDDASIRRTTTPFGNGSPCFIKDSR